MLSVPKQRASKHQNDKLKRKNAQTFRESFPTQENIYYNLKQLCNKIE